MVWMWEQSIFKNFRTRKKNPLDFGFLPLPLAGEISLPNDDFRDISGNRENFENGDGHPTKFFNYVSENDISAL